MLIIKFIVVYVGIVQHAKIYAKATNPIYSLAGDYLNTITYMYCSREQCNRLDLFINNELKLITKFLNVFCLQQQTMMWMRGHMVLIE